MKTKEELAALKAEVETLNNKLSELSEEELEDVTGGVGFHTLIPFLANTASEGDTGRVRVAILRGESGLTGAPIDTELEEKLPGGEGLKHGKGLPESSIIVGDYNKDVQHYMDGLINPEWAFRGR